MIIMFNIELMEIKSMGAAKFDEHDILAYLSVDEKSPTLDTVKKLMDAYTRTVPWESASRIAKRARTAETEKCPRFPDEFWRDAIRYGTGGTCYESNMAFFMLLKSLGYEGYLTVNNMHETLGCHTAIILLINGQKYVVDIGLPIYAPLRIDPARPAQTTSEFHTYTVTPQGNDTYEITRSDHPRPYCFTLIDIPVNEIDYRAVTTNDYGDDGLFLDKVVINLVIDGVQWRFGSESTPYQIEKFVDGEKSYYLLDEDLRSVAVQVSKRFKLDEDIVFNALTALEGQKG